MKSQIFAQNTTTRTNEKRTSRWRQKERASFRVAANAIISHLKKKEGTRAAQDSICTAWTIDFVIFFFFFLAFMKRQRAARELGERRSFAADGRGKKKPS